MCYYSLSLGRSEFRDARKGEDLVVAQHDGHGIVRGASDGRIVCVIGGTELHIAAFDLGERAKRAYMTDYPWLIALIGQPVTARFAEGNGEAADAILFSMPGHRSALVHLSYLTVGTTFYIGPKRPEPVDIANTLGVSDPSIVHDHKVDEVKEFTLVKRRRDLIAS